MDELAKTLAQELPGVLAFLKGAAIFYVSFSALFFGFIIITFIVKTFLRIGRTLNATRDL